MTDYKFNTLSSTQAPNLTQPPMPALRRFTKPPLTSFNDVDHAAALFGLQGIWQYLQSHYEPHQWGFRRTHGRLGRGQQPPWVLALDMPPRPSSFIRFWSRGMSSSPPKQLYGGSINQFGHAFKKFDWHVNWVDASDAENFRKALTPKTKAIFIESIANPGGVVFDIQAIADIAHEAGIPLIVDNTLATPYLCQPIKHGADIVVHSATKFIGGHGNSIGGIIVDGGTFDWSKDNKYPTLTEPLDSYHGVKLYEALGNISFAIACRVLGLRDLGPALAPMNAFLFITGLETLPLRMERHCANATRVAKHLTEHDKVTWVSYSGLESDPNHAMAKKYCPKGSGAVFTFGVKGGYDAGVKLVNSVELFSHLANVGDTRSLIIHPASTTHQQLQEDQREAAGAGSDVVRLSVGIEDVEDIIADLDQALAKI